jgi:class 3 adenylate cyclase
MTVRRDADDDDFMYKTKAHRGPFPRPRFCFADISGFTAWSSPRESQVFILLETIYKAFDRSAACFKVETVGDCYVAVTGLPTPHRCRYGSLAETAPEC